MTVLHHSYQAHWLTAVSTTGFEKAEATLNRELTEDERAAIVVTAQAMVDQLILVPGPQLRDAEWGH